jgi:hypothetical protein
MPAIFKTTKINQNAMLKNINIGKETRLRHDAHFTAEYRIHANVRFPFYRYEDFVPNPANELNGALFSKNAPFEILPNVQTVVMRSEETLDYSPLPPSVIPETGTPVFICCLNYAARSTTSATRAVKPPKETYLRIFPNPNADRRITVQYLTNEQKPATIMLRNAQGIKVAEWKPQLPHQAVATSLTFDLAPYRLAKGLYFVTLTYNNKTITQKLILE